MNERLFYKVTEFAELIGCSKTKAYELVASRAVPSIRIGGLLRIPAEALRKLGQADKENEDGRPAR